MKTIPPPCPEPESGIKYWRGLDELAETPEFREWAEREFPAGASEMSDPVTRRHFMKIMSASFVLAGLGLTGCRRPEHLILPFSKMPENYVHGLPLFYATAMPTRGSAVPLLVRSNDGRPTKVEGNPEHPDSNGGTDVFAQASILNLYDPDRAMRFTRGGNSVSREAALDYLGQVGQRAAASQGRGLAFLTERVNSPSRERLQKAIAQKYPQARWYTFEPVELEIARFAASTAFGRPVKPYYHFDKAKVVVSLDSDFLANEGDSYVNVRRFAQGRKLEKATDTMNRLYAVEGLMSLTGFNADHRLRVAVSAVPALAARLASEILRQSGQAQLADSLQPLAGASNQAHEKWIVECAKDLLAHRGECVVVAGYKQPLAVHVIANAVNVALGNAGKTVVYHEAPLANEGGIADLAQALNGGQVETLVVLGSNPAYNAPADLNWSAAQSKAKEVIRLGYYEEESFAGSTWHLPQAHYLESWGDSRTADGTVVAIQPLIEPLFGGITDLEVLARIGGLEKVHPYDIARETFAEVNGGANEEAWKKYLHSGFVPNSARQPVNVQLNGAAAAQAIGALSPAAAPSQNSLDVVFYRDYRLDDGRFSNNGWMQEFPDPVTKITWDNVVLMSRKTAAELSLMNGDLVDIEAGGRKVRGPVWVQPGMADYTLGLALGYGRTKAGRVGTGVGFNAYAIRTSTAPYIAAGAKVSKAGGGYKIATTQSHWSMEGRPIIREANLKQFAEKPNFVKGMDMHEPPGAAPLYPNPLDKIVPSTLHQWGMAIDLNACVGCSACVIACQSENNVPIVGKQQVLKSREMHWLRIDRYFSASPKVEADKKTLRHDDYQQFEQWIDDPQVVTQPMLCQHCEAAPCENVCPVNATVHDHEGLNVMAYNRCVGTRYCSNNCPYKVRRFNFFDYNKRPLDKLYYGPLAKRPEDELELVKLVKNPDVTVRMRGVMEKCTFCVQRIEGAKIAQKVKAGASGDVVVPEGTFTTACAQACAAGAIVFGNLKDPESRVSKLKQNPRNYSVLEFLATRPRLTYLARVRNPNPAMPDYYEMPLSVEEYAQKMGDPFKAHSHGDDHGASHGAAAEAGHGKGAH